MANSSMSRPVSEAGGAVVFSQVVREYACCSCVWCMW